MKKHLEMQTPSDGCSKPEPYFSPAADPLSWECGTAKI